MPSASRVCTPPGRTSSSLAPLRQSTDARAIGGGVVSEAADRERGLRTSPGRSFAASVTSVEAVPAGSGSGLKSLGSMSHSPLTSRRESSARRERSAMVSANARAGREDSAGLD